MSCTSASFFDNILTIMELFVDEWRVIILGNVPTDVK